MKLTISTLVKIKGSLCYSNIKTSIDKTTYKSSYKICILYWTRAGYGTTSDTKIKTSIDKTICKSSYKICILHWTRAGYRTTSGKFSI